MKIHHHYLIIVYEEQLIGGCHVSGAGGVVSSGVLLDITKVIYK